MAIRPNIPQHICDELMVRNCHTCCVCRNRHKHVQIHHIDGDNSHNTFENLAVLCLDDHSRVTGDEGLGRKFSEGEVRRYKADWEGECATEEEEEEDDDDSTESEEPDHHYEDSVLEAGSDIAHFYSLDEREQLAIWMDSDEPLAVFVMDEEDYELWSDGKDVDLHDYGRNYRLATKFVALDSGDYAVVFYNESADEANVQIDLSVWT